MKEQKFVKVGNVSEIENLQRQGWIITNMTSDSTNTYMVLERDSDNIPQMPQQIQQSAQTTPAKKNSGNELARISKMLVTIKLTAPNAEEHYMNGIVKLHQYLTEGYNLDVAEAIDDILRFRLSKRIEKGNYAKNKEKRKAERAEQKAQRNQMRKC